MVLTHIPMPSLPAPPSWFPGHMMKFTGMLPALLTKTDVVLEIRDSRLPLTSINKNLEGTLQKWRLERGWDPNNPGSRIVDARACEHLIVFNKRDLVPEWGIEPFRRAMAAKFPGQNILFASWNKLHDIRNLNEILVNIAKRYPYAIELNVLVIGMPNVGKSTLLNTLRSSGIKGRTPKAMRTSAHPGLTQALSTRLKLSLDPPVYAYDSPGVMLPFLGSGQQGAERGVKLALISGIKEGMYDMEALAAYLLYRLNVLNPNSPAYLSLLPSGAKPTNDLHGFLTQLAQRMGMLQRGGVPDLGRASVRFIRWWREEGSLLAASSTLHPINPICVTESNLTTGLTPYPVQGPNLPTIQGWGFDLEWEVSPKDMASLSKSDRAAQTMIQEKMENCISAHLEMSESEEKDESNISPTQRKKQIMIEEKKKRNLKQEKRLRARGKAGRT